MKAKEFILNTLKDKDYYLSLYQGGLYVYNFESLIIADEKQITITFDNNKYLIQGSNFKIKKLLLNEFEITGDIKKIEKIN